MTSSLSAAIRILATLCAAYIVSQFFRSSTAVIAPDLVRDIGFSPESLGLLTGAFFLAFGLTQIPLGILLDRFGARRTMAVMLLFAVAGSLLFAGAESPVMLTVGRALIGIGCAAVFMGSVVICARWFAPDRLATTASIVLAVGGAGNLLSATPLAYATEHVGWRSAFIGMAAITALIALAVFLLVRDAPPDHPFHRRKRETLGAVLRGLGEVLRNKRLPYLAAMAFVSYPAMATILTLWAGPYLADIHGLDGVGRGNVLLATGVAMILGTLLYGPLDRLLDTRKGIAMAGASSTAVVLMALALIAAPPLWLAVILLTLLGFFGTYSIMIMAHGRASFPEHLVGRAVTMVNFVNFTGVAVMQVLTGFIVGALTRAGDAPPEIAYRAVFGFLAVTVIIALFFYRRIGDAKPSEDKDLR
ncbi:MAG: MFS transporter [Alphaproteobacteria bacterium]